MGKFFFQKGYTLIELMIGLLVGMIVLTGTLYSFLTLVSSARDISNSSKLNRESSFLETIIAGELRRTGYWPPDGSSGTSPYTSIADLVVTSNCALYSYMNDSVTPAVSMARGIAYDAAGRRVLYGATTLPLSSCSTSGWVEIVPASTIYIDAFEFDLVCRDVTTGAVVPDSDCTLTNYDILSREVKYAFTASVVSDSDWVTSVSSAIKVPNDWATGN